MNLKTALTVVAFMLFGIILSGQSSNKVVTNPTPAVSATMSLVSSTSEGFTWQVQGKVKPSYRGFGATVNLICAQYEAVLFGSPIPSLIFGPAASDFASEPTNVDSCGNFSFQSWITGTSPQLDARYYCTFVVHVDGSKTPQACSSRPAVPSDFPADPNGTASCAGGLCPDAP